MSLIKKDKNIFNIFRKKKIKPVMSQKELDKLGIESYNGNQTSFVGIIIFITICTGIFSVIRQSVKYILPPEQLMAFNIIVPCIAVIMYWVFQIEKKTEQGELEEMVEDEEEEEDDEEE